MIITVPSAVDILKTQQKFNQWIHPKNADLLLRCQNRFLPLNYRFQHDPSYNSNCCHDCLSLETYQHLFWTCPHAQGLWSMFAPSFAAFTNASLSWKMVLTQQLQITLQWRTHVDEIHLVWKIFAGIVTLFLWEARNDKIFRQQQYPTTPVAQTILKGTVRRHLRFVYAKTRQSANKHRVRTVLRRALADNPTLQMLLSDITTDTPRNLRMELANYPDPLQTPNTAQNNNQHVSYRHNINIPHAQNTQNTQNTQHRNV